MLFDIRTKTDFSEEFIAQIEKSAMERVQLLLDLLPETEDEFTTHAEEYAIDMYCFQKGRIPKFLNKMQDRPRTNPVYKYCCIEIYKCLFYLKTLENLFPHIFMKDIKDKVVSFLTEKEGDSVYFDIDTNVQLRTISASVFDTCTGIMLREVFFSYDKNVGKYKCVAVR